MSQKYVLPTNAFESNLMRTSLANAAQSFGHSASQEGDEVIVDYATSVRIKYIVRDSVQMIVSSGLIARVLGSVDEEEAEAGFKAGAAKAHGKTKGKAAQELADATTARIQAAALAQACSEELERAKAEVDALRGKATEAIRLQTEAFARARTAEESALAQKQAASRAKGEAEAARIRCEAEAVAKAEQAARAKADAEYQARLAAEQRARAQAEAAARVNQVNIIAPPFPTFGRAAASGSSSGGTSFGYSSSSSRTTTTTVSGPGGTRRTSSTTSSSTSVGF